MVRKPSFPYNDMYCFTPARPWRGWQLNEDADRQEFFMTIEKKVSGTYKGLWMVRAQVQIDGTMYSSKRQYVKTKTEAKHLEEALKSELRNQKRQSIFEVPYNC